MRIKLLAIFCFIFLVKYLAHATDTVYIKVHFLYGSKPQKEYKNFEEKWFGGKFGGHVGIEYDSNKVIDFIPSGKFHKIAKKHILHSRFALRDLESFWSIFGGNSAQMKKATFVIPISLLQKQKLDSIVLTYASETPYDYAFWGMRCGSAAYDILAQIDVVKKYKHGTFVKIFYPQKLRKRLFKLSDKNDWEVIEQEGIASRKWEKD